MTPILDTFPAFLDAWAKLRDLPLEAQIEGWARLYGERWPELLIEGEMQADTAVEPSIALETYPLSRIMGDANVLVCPDLESANIVYKLLWRLGKVEAIGPILTGIGAPVHVLQTGVEVGRLDRAQFDAIFKSSLARGEVQMIGATTVTEYKTHIAEDEALARRFRIVTIPEPSLPEAREILIQEESQRLIDMDKVIKSAVERVEHFQQVVSHQVVRVGAEGRFERPPRAGLVAHAQQVALAHDPDQPIAHQDRCAPDASIPEPPVRVPARGVGSQRGNLLGHEMPNQHGTVLLEQEIKTADGACKDLASVPLSV